MDSKTEKVQEYIKEFNPKQMKAYTIAQSHLGSSFNILKSNGFKEWEKEKREK